MATTGRTGTAAVISRRAEHAADTRAALVDAARQLFAQKGFTRTATEEIVTAARVTRGALYHHFHDKRDLFAAVVADAAADMARRLVDERLNDSGSAFEDLRRGFAAFLDVCVGSDFQRLVLLEGPAVLGADTWESLVERHGLPLLVEWLERATADGDLDPLPARALARVLVAILTEASLAIARADDPTALRADMGRTLERILDGLRPR